MSKYSTYLEAVQNNENKSKLEAFMEISAMRKLKRFKDFKSFEQEVNSEMKDIAKLTKGIEQNISEILNSVAELLMTGFDMGGPAEENEDKYMASLNKAAKLIGKLDDAADLAREFDLDKLKKEILKDVEKNNSDFHEKEAESHSILSDFEKTKK